MWPGVRSPRALRLVDAVITSSPSRTRAALTAQRLAVSATVGWAVGAAVLCVRSGQQVGRARDSTADRHRDPEVAQRRADHRQLGLTGEDDDGGAAVRGARARREPPPRMPCGLGRLPTYRAARSCTEALLSGTDSPSPWAYAASSRALAALSAAPSATSRSRILARWAEVTATVPGLGRHASRDMSGSSPPTQAGGRTRIPPSASGRRAWRLRSPCMTVRCVELEDRTSRLRLPLAVATASGTAIGERGPARVRAELDSATEIWVRRSCTPTLVKENPRQLLCLSGTNPEWAIIRARLWRQYEQAAVVQAVRGINCSMPGRVVNVRKLRLLIVPGLLLALVLPSVGLAQFAPPARATEHAAQGAEHAHDGAEHAAEDLASTPISAIERKTAENKSRILRETGIEQGAARPKNVGTSDATMAAVSADPGVSGEWSPVIGTQVVPVFQALLPNGKVLMWDSVGDNAAETYTSHTFTRAMVWESD